MSLLHQLMIEVPLGIICFGVIWALLWKLRALRYWVVALGFGMFILSQGVLSLWHVRGGSAISTGIAIGTLMAILYMWLYLRKSYGKFGTAGTSIRRPRTK